MESPVLNVPTVKGLFRSEPGSNRVRLHFAAVEAIAPELADDVRLIRGRVRDLEKKFSEDAEWALRRFNWTTLGTLAIALLSIFAGLLFASGQDDPSTGSIAGFSLAAVATLAGAGTQAYGWHKRFGAMFAARWAMDALALRIDDDILVVLRSMQDKGGMDKRVRADLAKRRDRWLIAVSAALASFGTSYGAALEAPDIRPTRKGS